VKAIHAFVVPEAGAKPDDVRLKNALKQRLPDYMIPKTIRFLDALPVSANGKTDRKALNEI
jgi:acyl-coenzyme A synthetase/AMP-(fatty) acid ligase